jgi:hypothetical protein
MSNRETDPGIIVLRGIAGAVVMAAVALAIAIWVAPWDLTRPDYRQPGKSGVDK